MSLIKNQSKIEKYTIDLDTVKKLIAADLQCGPDELEVRYVIGDVGLGDPMAGYPAPQGVVRLEVTRTVPAEIKFGGQCS